MIGYEQNMDDFNRYQANYFTNNELILAEAQGYLQQRPDLRGVANTSNFFSQFGQYPEVPHNPDLGYHHQVPEYDHSDIHSFSNHLTPEIPVKDTKKRKKKSNEKGLRLFSKRVCDKVREKGETSYKSVAHELVQECKQNNEKVKEENVKRRVYDAINVLVAMDIIQRKKDKQIKWVGFPRANNDDYFDTTKKSLLEKIEKKAEVLEEVKKKYALYSNLIERNKRRKQIENDTTEKVSLPFILIRTQSSTSVQCEYSEDLSRHNFFFSQPFWIFEDSDTLSQIEAYESSKLPTSTQEKDNISLDKESNVI